MENYQPNKYDLWASNLLFFATGLSIVMNYFTKKGFFASHLTTGGYLGLYGGTAFTLALYYYLRTGVRGVKITFLVIYGLVVFNILSAGWIAKACDTPLHTFDFVSQHVLQLAASVLLIISLLKVRNTELATKEAQAAGRRG